MKAKATNITVAPKQKNRPSQAYEMMDPNVYSRNIGNNSSKSYSQKTQDLLQSVQQNAHIINNIKYGGIYITSKDAKKLIPSNINIRKSFGGGN